MKTMNQPDDNSSNGNAATIVVGTAVATPATADASITIEAEEAEKVCHDYENNSCRSNHHQQQRQRSLEAQLERQTQIATQQANDKVNNNNVESSLASPPPPLPPSSSSSSSGVVVVPNHHHDDDHGEDSPASYVVQTVKLTSNFTSKRQRKSSSGCGGGGGNHGKSSGRNLEPLVESSHVSKARALPVDGGSDEQCCYVSGENLRCNCAGTRRTTLSGLIELFEQGVTITTTNSPDRSSANGAWQDRWQRRRQQQRRRKARELHSYGLDRGQARRTRGVPADKQMRNIITPVRYEPSEEDCDETTDSLEYIEVAGAADTGPSLIDDAGTPDSATVNRSLRYHVAVKGVPVLPCSKGQLRKLTATNWQPPTDARKYDSLRPASRGSRNHFHHHYDTTTRDREQPESVYFSDDNTEDGPEEEDQDECNKNNRPTRRYSRTAQLAATGGPSIVKHQPSSSRRLLNQLARLRRLSEPQYRVKRPEKVAQVESLIEQLERATADWEEDELLLDRAERRDWPQEYHRRFTNKQPTVHQHHLSTEKAEVQRRADVHPFEEQTIARSHSVLAMAASTLTTMTTTTTRTTSASAASADNLLPLDADGVQQRSATLGSRKPRRKPAALADRYHDDLAVRRLSNRSPASQFSSQSRDPKLNNLPQMSYLLCSSAYTPSIESGRQSNSGGNRKQQLLDWNSESLDRRLRADDLHYRSVKTSRLPPPHEPPFGIPRQPTLASAHSTGSHYLRRQSPHQTQTGQECHCIPSQVQRGQSRPESKVSFRDEHTSGFASADSGLAVGGLSPSSMGGRLSAASRLTPSSPSILERQSRPQSRGAASSDHLQQQQPRQQVADDYVDDAAEEVDLGDELQGVDQETLAEWLSEDVHCDSPTLECHQAQFGSTPTRRRPKIKIGNPRSKSPLVKVVDRPKSSSEPQVPKVDIGGAKVQVRSYTDAERWRPSSSGATSELECQYLFNDEDEDAGEELPKAKPVVSTIKPGTSGESSMNESSIERLNYRGGNRMSAGNLNEEPKMQSRVKKDTDKKAPLFSIGQYKSMLNKPQLKIL